MTPSASDVGLKTRLVSVDSKKLPQDQGSFAPCGFRFTFK